MPDKQILVPHTQSPNSLHFSQLSPLSYPAPALFPEEPNYCRFLGESSTSRSSISPNRSGTHNTHSPVRLMSWCDVLIKIAKCVLKPKEDVSYFHPCPKHHILSMKLSRADTSLIYCIVCSKCEKLYIGVCFCMHRHAFETKRRVPVYQHFARKSHDFVREHRIVPLKQCEPDAQLEREAF